IGDEPFVVILPDVIIDDYESNLEKDNLAEMITHFEQTGESQIMVEPVPMQDVNKFGVVDLGDEKITQGQNARILNMVEKPPVNKAPSNLAVVGR
ncbi:sugar phosphate nucleotidyltransferase, partial [Enterococcus faecium]|uniref:sugar phosphate nucleotidyltransferase n=1 Tax=Enterococcus faecium TaxID=1352 RepID=UPI0034E94BFB